ncbi:MAG TPA: ABC transporter permease [Thermomicrobiaceae bacterium]|nr:ABC transporter permease [Thermomicrobiaceae bacterium]
MASQAVEAFHYRSLVRNLVAKDLKVRYKNSALGFLWSLLNPLLMMIVFTFVFTQLLNQNIADFPVFVLAALLPWQWTQSALSLGTSTLVENAPLIGKVYFPRLLLPVSVVLSTMMNFVLALPALFAIMALFGRPFTPWILYIPVIVAVQAIFLVALLLILAPLHVFFRDTIVLVEVGLTAWFFVTPIFYPIEAIAPRWSAWVYRVNPMAAIVAEYRTILYHGGVPDPLFMARTGATAVVLLIAGYLIFARLNHILGEHL